MAKRGSGPPISHGDLTQNKSLVYRWKVTYNSGANAGTYIYASAAAGTERGSPYRI